MWRRRLSRPVSPTTPRGGHGIDAAVADGSAAVDCRADRDAVGRRSALSDADLKLPPVKMIEVPREPDRPSGLRFGALVHAVLGTVPLDGDADVIQRLTTLQGRTLGATDEEVESAAKVVQTVLALPFSSARAKQPQTIAAGVKCRSHGVTRREADRRSR